MFIWIKIKKKKKEPRTQWSNSQCVTVSEKIDVQWMNEIICWVQRWVPMYSFTATVERMNEVTSSWMFCRNVRPNSVLAFPYLYIHCEQIHSNPALNIAADFTHPLISYPFRYCAVRSTMGENEKKMANKMVAKIKLHFIFVYIQKV